MKIKAIKEVLIRWSIVETFTAIDRGDFNDIKAGKVVDVDNESGIWFIKNGYCEQVRESEKPAKKKG